MIKLGDHRSRYFGKNVKMVEGRWDWNICACFGTSRNRSDNPKLMQTISREDWRKPEPSETTCRISLKHESNRSNINWNVIHRRLSFTEIQEQLAVLLRKQIETTCRHISRLHDAVFRTAVVSGSSWKNARRIISRHSQFEGNWRIF